MPKIFLFLIFAKPCDRTEAASYDQQTKGQERKHGKNSSQQELDHWNESKPPKTPTGASQNNPAPASTGNTYTASPDKQAKQKKEKETAKVEQKITKNTKKVLYKG